MRDSKRLPILELFSRIDAETSAFAVAGATGALVPIDLAVRQALERALLAAALAGAATGDGEPASGRDDVPDQPEPPARAA